MTIAAIDIGSSAVRLLIAEVLAERGGGPLLVKRKKKRVPLALGREVFASGRITDTHAGALVKVLTGFSRIIGSYPVDSVAACATAALRRAANGAAVIREIAAATGMEVAILSGEQEAALIAGYHLACFPPGDARRLYIDVGGGSTEVSLYQGGNCLAVRSFPLGSLRTAPGTSGTTAWKELRTFLSTHATGSPLEASATGGNIRKLHKLAGKGRDEMLNYQELLAWYGRLRQLSIPERISFLGLKPDRAAVIVPALAIYCRFMEWGGLQQLAVPRIGLADGIAFARYQALTER